jgi:hypothetical protein
MYPSHGFSKWGLMSINNNARCLLAAFVCVALLFEHAFAQVDRWEEHMTAGRAAAQQGIYAEAEKQFSAALIEA